NVTLDLREGRSRARSRDDLITKASPVCFDEDAKCPTFDAFMRAVFLDDEERIRFVLRWLGYCMTAVTTEQAMVVSYGLGANGKSTFFDVVADVLGDYHASAPPQLLVAKR